MYKKYLVVASKEDVAGMNIVSQLSQFRGNPLLSSIKDDEGFFDVYICNDDILFEENLFMEKIAKYDFVIFASRHKSSSGQKSLCIHAPGNFGEASMGGKDGKVAPTSALFQKDMFETLNKNFKDHELRDFVVTMEATHHGPLINKPCLFIEIGSDIDAWKNKKAGFIVAKTISDCVLKFKPNRYREVGFGIGGTHYCPEFNKVQLNSNVALSYVVPKYNLPLTEEMVRDMLASTEEEVDFAVLNWKGLGNKEFREQVISVLDKLYVSYKKIGELR